MSGDVCSGDLARHIRGGISQFVWKDDVVWGEVPLQSHVAVLARHARERPDSLFLDFEGETLTFAQLQDRATAMAHALADLGVAAGASVAVVMDNSADQVVSLFAVNLLGAIWVPVNTAYRGEFLRHQLADSRAVLAICDAGLLDDLLHVAPGIPDLARILVRGADTGALPAACIPVEPLDRHRGADLTPIVSEIDPRDISCLIYTSGTTGPSKGCMVSHAYLCSIGRRRNLSVEPWPGMIAWSCLPLFHIASLAAVLISTLLAGERASIARHFSVSGFWKEIERSGADSAVLLATMLPLVAHMPDCPEMARCKGQLKVITGVPMTQEDRRIWRERFGVAYVNTHAYGQTEANLVTFLPWGEPEPPAGSMGPPSRDFDMMVVDDEGVPVPLDTAGELVLRPRQPGAMFSGYWQRAEDTVAASRDLWWRTGDVVRMDAGGYLYFVDRKKDYLRSRGENISSHEVESAVGVHPEIAEVAFHSVPAEEGVEEQLKATVVLAAAASCDERALFDWMRGALPYFAVPRFIELRERLPKTPTGKVQKQDLRMEGVTASTWDSLAHGLEIRRPRR